MDKRTFLKSITFASIGTAPVFKALDKILADVSHLSPEEVAKDEDFWARVRSEYRLKPDYINLENGYYCITPQETLEKYIQHARYVNYQGSYYMRTVARDNKKRMAGMLAEVADCEPEELIITRNTTEALDIIIGGIHWKEGDEAVFAEQDYGAMKNMFKLQERRHGIINKIINVPMHPTSDEEIVEAYAKAITPKTRLLMICHMINITGHILPVRKICDMAHSKGVEVMVDGAHAFGHIQFSMKDLDCDYYGTSLHKWTSVPLGSGFLFIKKEKISGVWETFADWGAPPDDIYRLNNTGTHPVHTDLAVGNALEYHNRLGGDRKEARLRYLQNYWCDQVRDLDHIILNTPKDRQRSCAIANVGIKDMKPHDLATTLMEKYKIWTVAIDGAGVHGCRITPNVYTTTKELDAFVAALKDMA